MKKQKHTQLTLFGSTPEKKKRNKLSPSEKSIKKEKEEAHRAWKIYKAHGFDSSFLTQEQINLLNTHYKA